MTIKVVFTGKTDHKVLESLMQEYVARLKHYIKLDLVTLPNLKNTKNLSEKDQKKKEAEQILKQLDKSDFLVLLDERGKEYSSLTFADYLQKRMNSGLKQLVFVVGGPYGFDASVKARANGVLSLSKMTFSHQMVRLFFLEQLYRGFTILKNEPYHHQ